MNLNILFNGCKYNININNDIYINDLILKIYNSFLKDLYDQSYNFILLFNGEILYNKLSDYNIKENTELQLLLKSDNKNIDDSKSIFEDYIISPILPNSIEKNNNIIFNLLLKKIENIENELSLIKEYINDLL